MKICVLSCILFLPIFSFTQVDWIQINNPNGTKIETIVPGPDGYVYLLSTGDIFYRSDDEGDNWEALTLPDNVTNIGEWTAGSDGSLWLQSDQTLYQLRPDIYVWNTFNIPGDLSSLVGVAALPDGDIIATSSQGAMYRLSVITSTWNMVYEEEAYDFEELVMGVGGFYYLHDNDLLIRRYSIDGSLEVNLSWPSGGAIRDFKQQPGGDLWILSFGGMYRSADHGDNWTHVPTIGFGVPSDMGFGYSGTVHLFSNSFNSHYVLSESGTGWATPENLFFETFSGTTPVPLASGKALFYNGLCGSGILLRSNEDGSEIQDITHTISEPRIRQIKGDYNSQLYVRTCGQDWQVTNDGGDSWSSVRINGIKLRFFDVGPGGKLIAATAEQEYYLSMDEGENWNQIPHPLLAEQSFYSAHYLHDNVFVFCGGYNDPIVYTLDGGQTFQEYMPAFPPEDIYYHPEGYLFINNRFSPDITRLERINLNNSTGGELDNLPLNGLTSLQLLVTDAGSIFYLGATDGNPEIYRSDDLGATFIGPLPITTTSTIHEYPDKIHLSSDQNGNIYLRSGPDIVFSTDEGVSWQNLVDPPYLTGPGGIYIDRANYLYRMFYTGKIYRSALPLPDFGSVSGTFWNDLDEDCATQSDDEPSLSNWLAEAAGLDNTFYSHTNNEGDYRFSLPPGSFIMNPVVSHPLYTTCAENIPLEILGNEGAVVNFPLTPTTLCPLVTAHISTPLRRCWFDNTYTVNVCNDGTMSAENTTIDIVLDVFFTFQSSTITPAQIDGQTYTFALGDLPLGTCTTFDITVNVSCEAELGQEHCVSWTTSPGVECAPSYSTDIKECQVNVGSYDPNDKRAFVDGQEITDYLLPGTERLTYHIRFQNTGTDTAFTVLIEDVLPPELDAATFHLENSSHPCEVIFTPANATNTHQVSFLFRNILLPDSTTNEPASNGFVKFSIAPKAGLELGEDINNVADIFFDFNEPVRTNILALEYNYPNAVGDLKGEEKWVTLYPNPTTGQLNIVLKNDLTLPLSIVLFNTQGQPVLRQNLINNISKLDISRMPKGLYFLQVLREGTSVQGMKVVVQ